MLCLGFEPGPQDGRHRWNHRAMAATLHVINLCKQCNYVDHSLLGKVLLVWNQLLHYIGTNNNIFTSLLKSNIVKNSPYLSKINIKKTDWFYTNCFIYSKQHSFCDPQSHSSDFYWGNLCSADPSQQHAGPQHAAHKVLLVAYLFA